MRSLKVPCSGYGLHKETYMLPRLRASRIEIDIPFPIDANLAAGLALSSGSPNIRGAVLREGIPHLPVPNRCRASLQLCDLDPDTAHLASI